MQRIVRVFLACLIAAVCTCSPYPLNTVDKEIASEIKNEPHIYWRPSVNASMWEAKKFRKPVALYIYLNGCSFCTEIENKTFSDLNIIKILNDEFIPIWMNAELNADNVLALDVATFPSIVIFTPDGVEISVLEGFLTPEELEYSLRELSEYVKDLEEKSYSEWPRLRIGLRPGTYRL